MTCLFNPLIKSKEANSNKLKLKHTQRTKTMKVVQALVILGVAASSNAGNLRGSGAPIYLGGHHHGKYAEGIARQPEGEGIARQPEDVSTTTFTQTASTLAADPAIRTIKNAYLAPEVLGNHCPEGECVLEGTAICEPCSSSAAMDAM